MSPQSVKILWQLVSRLEAQQSHDRDRTQHVLQDPEIKSVAPLSLPVSKAVA